ncbi:DUF6929 family protein [Flavobacterium hiemivividum]|uniref:Uncharacterized protein n=1 Tax=Flavobacterium hiemivividum TaxID=2541734 RepID=A0A4R5D3P9_9FLAO|nr:hypothetical protein [Flavobacterium hiemivividum]TDE06101.1 hypothetical protein E0F98_00300 [Flavobacterium hiemivividum]
MKKITLELFTTIIGLGSASGLFFQGNFLYLIGDNSGFLYEYNIVDSNLKKYPLLENPSQNIPKKDKPDFESLTHFGDTLYVFGSGSTAKRNAMIEFDLNTRKKSTTNNLVDLYAVMQSFGYINPEDFNLEGAIYDGENWYFFNRGNGSSSKNVIFTLHAKKLNEEFSLLSNDYKLPKIKGVRTSFTDAILVDNKIYFLATAENTISTYDDGEVLGSIIGRIDLESMKIDFTKKISPTNKFEGLTLYSQNENQIQFLLCEDKDTDTLESTIYKLSLELR